MEAASLGRLESVLRCPICQELLDGAISLTTCGHTFCSECVRRSLGEKSVCPSCRKESSSAQLWANRSLQEVVRVLKSLKEEAASGKRTRKRKEQEREGNSREERDKEEQGAKPMAGVVYHMTKEKDLRQMLRELGLPSTGAKDRLILRHKEYSLLFNAALDRDGFVSQRERRKIVRQVLEKEKALETEKKTQSIFAKEEGGVSALEKMQMSQDFRHSFEQLVKDVLSRKKEKGKHKKIRKRFAKLKRKRQVESKQDKQDKQKEQEKEKEVWRKVYSDKCKAFIFFNTETLEVIVKDDENTQTRKRQRADVIELDIAEEEEVKKTKKTESKREETTNQGPWSCTACTFLNAAEKRECEICLKARPGSGTNKLLDGRLNSFFNKTK